MSFDYTCVVQAEIQHVLDVVDRVHRDGDLPTVLVHSCPSLAEPAFVAYYDPQMSEISVTIDSDTPELDFCHELGHLLDHRGIILGRSGADYRSSEDFHDHLLDGWRDAVQGSSAVGRLKEIGAAIPSSQEAPYLLRPRELWARSYAQYVACKSCDPVLMRQLSTTLGKQEPLQSCTQWTECDFKPIADQIEILFRKKGWLP